MTSNLLFISLVLILFIVLICWIFRNSIINQNEGMDNMFYNFYMQNFHRPPDPITSKYYRSKNEAKLEAELMIYKNQVFKGLKFIKTKGLVITGLIRNAEFNIPFLKKFYNVIKSITKKSIFIIIENDSEDDTRARLLEWQKEDSTIIILCDYNKEGNVPVCNITGHHQVYKDKSPHVARIRKLSYLRNIYIDYIEHYINLEEFEYLCVMDLDLNGSLYLDGVLHSFYQMSVDSTISGIACNGMVKSFKNGETYFKYYDSFAFVEFGEPHEWSNEFDKSSHDEDVLNYVTQKYHNNMNIDKVTSAFGGFCIYRLQEIIKSKARYEFSRNNKLSCEHAHFHKKLNKLVVNPRMIFLIQSV